MKKDKKSIDCIHMLLNKKYILTNSVDKRIACMVLLSSNQQSQT